MQNLGLKLSPFAVTVATGQKLVEQNAMVRAKHWFRVIYRRASDGKTWGDWMRFYPPVDLTSEAVNGNYRTKAQAKAGIAKEQARHAREQKVGKSHLNLGGGMVASMDVEKGAVYQYLILEEVTLTLNEELVG
jgi:hypothetical protein